MEWLKHILIRDNDWRSEEVALISQKFSFLVDECRCDQPETNITDFSIKVIYKNRNSDRQVVLLHDLVESFFYFYVMNGVDRERSDSDHINIKTFLDIFNHYDKSIRLSDIEPAENENTDIKLLRNAELLHRYGYEVVSGQWW